MDRAGRSHLRRSQSAAFPAWAAMPPGARQKLFLSAADIVERRMEELVELMAVEGGASRAFSSFQVRLSAAMLRQAAGWGYLPAGDILRSDVPGRTAMVTRKPLGVVAGFTPWNGAFYLACINFTGSDKTARILGAQAGRALKRMVLELGGFNPVLVLDDADLEESIKAVTFGAFLHQGQVCMNTRKVYVDSSIHDEFVSGLADRVRALKSGDPIDPEVIIGPLINDDAVAQIELRVQDAVDRGATLVTGGQANGRIYPPTILTDVPADAICTTGADETFGPLLVVQRFDDAELALAEAQRTPYGLSAAIMTRDRARGLDMAQRVDSGIVHVNAPTMASEAALPVGGVKDSGWGRSGHYAIEDFTELVLTTVSNGPGHYPF
ncbi:aldehyde dehydrogenase family protein [Agreia sp.]|uniref:aldehyde dehydrogenase family protein n=1 Tax=Agreia sp. TaxID=1872416 RepID=UPI0035BC68AA